MEFFGKLANVFGWSSSVDFGLIISALFRVVYFFLSRWVGRSVSQ